MCKRISVTCHAGRREASSVSWGPSSSVLHLCNWASWLLLFRGFPTRSHEVNVMGNAVSAGITSSFALKENLVFSSCVF